MNMNCLSHAWRFLDDGYFAAGTCVPDWLGMIDRKVRVRRKNARAFLEQGEIGETQRAIAAGILQHLDDDDWFHGSRAFSETSLQLSQMTGAFPGCEPGHRAGFVGHILVELLLDACIEEDRPGTIQRYYHVIGMVSAFQLQTTVNQLAAHSTWQMESFLRRYMQESFLFDYLDDGRLLYRLNRVLSRVRLEPLGEDFVQVIDAAREIVRGRWRELLAGP